MNNIFFPGVHPSALVGPQAVFCNAGKRELVPLFFKVRDYVSGSELKEDAVECVQILALK